MLVTMGESGISIILQGQIYEERVKKLCDMVERDLLNSGAILGWSIGTSVINVMVRTLYLNLGLKPPINLRKQMRKINSLILEKGFEPVLELSNTV
jgi:hypothetical protein